MYMRDQIHKGAKCSGVVPELANAHSGLIFQFQMAHLQNEDVSKCPPITWNCWTLLELTDALCPLEEVHSRMAELIRLHVNAG